MQMGLTPESLGGYEELYPDDSGRIGENLNPTRFPFNASQVPKSAWTLKTASFKLKKKKSHASF